MLSSNPMFKIYLAMLLPVSWCLMVTSGYVLGECREGCKEPTLFYDDLKCKPIFSSPGDCCPSNYNCSHIEERVAANEHKCYFEGNTYSLLEKLNDDDILANCQVGCTCRKNSRGVNFNCAILDCPEALHPIPPKPGCHYKQLLNHCCKGDEVCPPFDATCEVGGKTLYDGMAFEAPNNKCTTCVCQKGFNGTFEEPFCRKRKCIEEISRQKQVNNFCAPSFITLDDCCPFTWKCPEKEDVIVPAPAASDLKCKYGEQSLNIGDKFERTKGGTGKMSCECRIPPYLTCIQNYDYGMQS